MIAACPACGGERTALFSKLDLRERLDHARRVRDGVKKDPLPSPDLRPTPNLFFDGTFMRGVPALMIKDEQVKLYCLNCGEVWWA